MALRIIWAEVRCGERMAQELPEEAIESDNGSGDV